MKRLSLLLITIIAALGAANAQIVEKEYVSPIRSVNPQMDAHQQKTLDKDSSQSLSYSTDDGKDKFSALGVSYYGYTPNFFGVGFARYAHNSIGYGVDAMTTFEKDIFFYSLQLKANYSYTFFHQGSLQALAYGSFGAAYHINKFTNYEDGEGKDEYHNNVDGVIDIGLVGRYGHISVGVGYTFYALDFKFQNGTVMDGIKVNLSYVF